MSIPGKKCAFSLFFPEIEFLMLYITLFYLGTLALWLPTVKHPNVEKNSSISFCRRWFLFSASSRARSEFLSFISSIMYFFRSWSSSSSNLTTCFLRSALVSSILKTKGERGRRKKKRVFLSGWINSPDSYNNKLFNLELKYLCSKQKF